MTAWSRWHLTCWVVSSHFSHHPAKFVDLVPCERENKIFLTCHVTTQLTWLCGWIFLTLSPHPAMFGVHTLYESGNITFFSCQVTTMSKYLCRWGPLILSHHPAKFRVNRPCESGDIKFFICHVITILKCHVTLWVGFPHPKTPPC